MVTNILFVSRNCIHIHAALTPDLLHQVTKCFFDHSHSIVVGVIDKESNSGKAKGEIDARFSHVPPYIYVRLKGFREGINKLPRWQGPEYRAMVKVYLGVGDHLHISQKSNPSDAAQ